MKIWLDDIRPAPENWIRVFTAWEAIEILEKGGISEISLDHDLGNPENGTGKDVTKKVCEWVFKKEFDKVPGNLKIHSANPVGRQNMESDISWINRNRE